MFRPHQASLPLPRPLARLPPRLPAFAPTPVAVPPPPLGPPPLEPRCRPSLREVVSVLLPSTRIELGISGSVKVPSSSTKQRASRRARAAAAAAHERVALGWRERVDQLVAQVGRRGSAWLVPLA